MKLLLLLLMLTVCAAIPQDLSGKMFTFPQPTNTAHVKLTPSRQDLKAATVCFRSFTDLRRGYSFFSLSTPSTPNNLLIWMDPANDEIEIYMWGDGVQYGGLNYKLSTWHSMCSTWDSESGLGQVWLDGKPSSRKFIRSGTSVNGTMIIVLGQEQDSHGGAFDVNQSFIGMMSDVHMWDHVLSPCEIHRYMGDLHFTPGNVLNWKALEAQTVGRVLIEEKQIIYE